MFKPNPKAQVSLVVSKLYGRDVKHTVTGTRLAAAQCKSRGYPVDTFLAELVVGSTVAATARARDWRKAYKLLALEVEKLYADGRDLV